MLRNGGGIMLYVQEDVPAKLIGSEKLLIESFYVELNLRGQKWLLKCSYHPSRVLTGEHVILLSKNLDLQSSKYERFVFVVYFNVGMKNEPMKDFCNLQDLTTTTDIIFE